MFLPLARSEGEIPEGGINSTLSGDGMTSRREQFSNTSSIETSFSETESGSQASAASTNNNSIILVIYHRILIRHMRLNHN